MNNVKTMLSFLEKSCRHLNENVNISSDSFFLFFISELTKNELSLIIPD